MFDRYPVRLVIIWLVSLVLALPAAIFSHLIKQDIAEKINGTIVYKQIAICYPFPEELGPNYPKMVVMVRALVHYGIPLLTIGTFYAIMARHLLRRSLNNLKQSATLARHFKIDFYVAPRASQARP